MNMGNLSELNLRTSYRKWIHNIADDFYLPCMERAVTYDRAVGFFSSTIYMIAWSALKEFVENEGKFRIITSQILSNADIQALEEGYTARIEESAGENIKNEILGLLEDENLVKPTRVLASLVSLGILDLKIALIHPSDVSSYKWIFHDKVGIFKDTKGHTIVFKGSMNETWPGLSDTGNLESVDVYLDWGGERDEARVKDEVDYFESLWADRFPLTRVREFPNVAREELINSADVEKWPELVQEIIEELKNRTPFNLTQSYGGLTLRNHQLTALINWSERSRRGILEHATGSGKTFTALVAMDRALSNGEIPLVIVPTEVLLEQWKKEITATLSRHDPRILICGGNGANWRDGNLLRRWTRSANTNRIVLATVQTASRDDFLDQINESENIFLVADEVHRLGSRTFQNILKLETGPRLGLSATPRRAGDPNGTSAIFSYFNGIVPPPYTLQDAISDGTLTPYYYYVHTTHLTEHEQGEWKKISSEIGRLYAMKRSKPDIDESLNDRISQLRFKRARIIKGAENKVSTALDIIGTNYEPGQKWLVYCDTQDQLRELLGELQSERFTAVEYHSAMSGDRELTLRYFEINGGIIVSIRCLDEGVDIPSTTHALIIASSKNPREFIQRRGRVLRIAPNKHHAFIHDLLVLPSELGDDEDELSFVEGELARAIQFGQSAENPAAMADIRLLATQANIDIEQYIDEGFEDD